MVMESLQQFASLGTIKKLVLRMIAFTLEAWQVRSRRTAAVWRGGLTVLGGKVALCRDNLSAW